MWDGTESRFQRDKKQRNMNGPTEVRDFELVTVPVCCVHVFPSKLSRASIDGENETVKLDKYGG